MTLNSSRFAVTLNRSEAAQFTGLVAGTKVMTLAGEMPVECLSVGERIITRSGARVLRAVHTRSLPMAKLLCISASALGVEQPQDDMHVGPDQGLHIRDWRAQALKGVDQTVIAARELADGEYIRMETVLGACLFSLSFDRDEVIYANGLELSCNVAAVSA